ncbi:MAG: phosphate ABC transporter permease [Candidatus Altiarchaeales archaeon WOR_SM1_86-2]|nr:MAG: phosphate ABC transporter permease [Candidatus Altiarchaeales archaeon WOR_SM1_86-2]ODS38037.1 MAG: phosphate ABC transporter permease [Candidatus Altiarchaeales archaeon WOR_SM1_79]
MNFRTTEENIFKILMFISLIAVMGSLIGIMAVVLIKGGAALSIGMVTTPPESGYYLGGEGGILNAIVGSVYLASGATVLAFFISIAIAIYLQREFTSSKAAGIIRTSLDMLWGIPSIVYGVFCFIVMMYLGIGTCLLAGIIALTMIEIPIMTRGMDEAIKMVPPELKESTYVLGSNRIETAIKVVLRQGLPGITSAVLLAFGRGIGDAASILFTAGFSDHIPASLFDSAAALPTMIFFLSALPSPEVRDRAYAAAFILLSIVLLISLASRLLTNKFSRYIIK